MNKFDEMMAREKKWDDDARRFVELDRDRCMISGTTEGHMRSLIIEASLPLDEVIPEAINLNRCPNSHLRGRGWYLNISDQSLNMLMSYLEAWRSDCQIRPQVDASIPKSKVRILPPSLKPDAPDDQPTTSE